MRRDTVTDEAEGYWVRSWEALYARPVGLNFFF